MIILGIDPGIEGGMALIYDKELIGLVQSTPTHKRKIDWVEYKVALQKFNDDCGTIAPHAAIEIQKHYAGMANTRAMIENFGKLKLLLDQVGIPFSEIDPTHWRKAYRPKGQGKRQTDPTLKDAAQSEKQRSNNAANKIESTMLANSFWPQAAKYFGDEWNSGTQEAALIGAYCQRLRRAESLGGVG